MFDIEQKGDKKMSVYQNVGNAKYYGLNGVGLSAPAVSSPSGDKTKYIKNGMVIAGFMNGYAVNGGRNSNNLSSHKDSVVTSINFYSLNNFNNYYNNVASGGLAILAIPQKIVYPIWKYSEVDKKYYNYINDASEAQLATYETWEYWLIGNIVFKDGTKKTTHCNYSMNWKGADYSYNGNEISSFVEAEGNPTNYSDGKIGMPFSPSQAMNNENKSTTLYCVNGKTTGYTYNRFYEGEKEKFVNDWAKYSASYTGTAITGRNFPYTDFDRFSQDAIFRKINTNLPIFTTRHVKELFEYFKTGNIEGADNYDNIILQDLDWSTDWKLYVDGKEPSIKLVWESQALENYLNSEQNTSHITLDSIKVELSQNNIEGERVALDFVPYTNGYYKTSYAQLAEKFDMIAWDKFLANIIGSQTGIGEIPFYFKIYYGKLYSTLCYCKIPYSTEPTDYGKVPTIDIQDNSTVTVIYGSDGSEDDGYKDRTEADDLPEKGTDGTEGQNASGLLSTVYVMTETRLKQLASFLWSDNFFQNIKLLNNSPIENIVSCKVMPCSASGTDSPITLGNVSTGVNGDKTSSSMRVQIGSLAIPKYYNSFLDYAPYTKLTIFLPFIGFKELDTNLFMGKTLKLYYVFDFITGAVKAQIFANDIYCMSFDATAGIDIPITASNRAQVEASYIKSALSVGGSIASGNPLVAVGGLLESASAQYHYNTQGTFSPSCGFHDTRLAYVIYDRPTAQYPTTYNHNCGKPCLLSRNLGSVSGYTEVDNGIELSGIPCTESERKEILDLLTTGIFL